VALALLAPAASVFGLCLVTQGWFVVVWIAALTVGLGLLLCPGIARLYGVGALLGCAAVATMVLSTYE
jgi:hypothetical protein